MRGKEPGLIIAALLMLNFLTVLYFLSKPSEANGIASGNENAAVIGKYAIPKRDWLKELEDRYGKAVLKDMIDQQVIKEMAAKYQITVSDKDVERELNMTLTTYHADEKKWKDQIKTNLLLEEILIKNVHVSDKEMQSYYLKNKSQFTISPAYQLSQIIVKTKEDAEICLTKLSHGASFSTMAMTQSIEEFSAGQGGDIGYISKDGEQYPEAYIQAAKKLKPGQWSEPIKVNQGYAIILLHKAAAGKSYSYNEVKAQIRRQIAMEQIKTPVSVTSFWNEANVKWPYGD